MSRRGVALAAPGRDARGVALAAPGRDARGVALPDRDAADQLAAMIRQRGMAAEVRQTDAGHVLTARNPDAPGSLCQRVALVRDRDGADVFVWLFSGPQRGTWEPELLGPAAEVEQAAERLARVIATVPQR